MKDGYLSLTEAALLLPHGSRGYLNVLIRRGQLKAEKAGKFWYTTRAWVDEYMSVHPALAAKRLEHQPSAQPRIALAEAPSMEVLRLQLELARAKAQVAYLADIPTRDMSRQAAQDKKTVLIGRQAVRMHNAAGQPKATPPLGLIDLAFVIPALFGFIGGLFLVALFITITSGGAIERGVGELRASLDATARIVDGLFQDR